MKRKSKRRRAPKFISPEGISEISKALELYSTRWPRMRLLRAAKQIRAGEPLEEWERKFVARVLVERAHGLTIKDCDRYERNPTELELAEYLSWTVPGLSREMAARFLGASESELPARIRAIARLRRMLEGRKTRK